MKRYASCTWFLMSAVCITSFPSTVHSAKTTAPKEVVAHYLLLDGEAAGLSPNTWPELGALTSGGKQQPPTWDTFIVIDRYEIGKQVVGSTRAQVGVTYYPLGKLSASFEPNTEPERVTYHLNKTPQGWRVDTPQLIPHVMWPVMKKRLEEASSKDAAAKSVNEVLIRQIEAVKPPTP